MGKGVQRRVPSPTRKVSETFLSFAEPLLQNLPEDPVRHVENSLRIAYVVWNAVVLADVLGEDQHLADTRHRLGSDPAGRALAKMLISRKRALFGDDAWLIGRYEVRRTSDGFNVQADARDPNTVPHRQRR